MFEKQEKIIKDKVKLGTFKYNDIHDIIEYLIKAKSAKIRTIGIFDVDDIAQEVRIKCFNILHKFSSSKGSALNFFGTCIDNSLIDLIRRHTLRRSNVCFYCLFNIKGVCQYYIDIDKCEKYSRFLINKKNKEVICLLRGNSDFEWKKVESDKNSEVNSYNLESKIFDVRNFLTEESKVIFDSFMNNVEISDEQEKLLYQEVKYVISKFIY